METKGKNLDELFSSALLEGCEEAWCACHYPPTRFRRMVRELGGVETAKRLLHGDGIASGLAELWECGRLDLTLEAMVIQPQWRVLFTAEELAVAQDRLKKLGYHLPGQLS